MEALMKKRFIPLWVGIIILWSTSLVWGQLRVVATYPWIGDLVQKIGQERVAVFVLARGTEDPHFIVPKLSYIAKLRQADLLIINGAGLEIGFIPILVQQAGNSRIQEAGGFLDLSRQVRLSGVPAVVSRSEGDIHPEGNPHFLLDYHRMPALAGAVKNRLCSLDPNHCSIYEKNLSFFLTQWGNRSRDWDKALAALKGSGVIEYHRLFDYLLDATGLIFLGTVEPKPGIPPTARHIEELVNIAKTRKAAFILQDVYHEEKSARFLAEKSGVRYILLPHDVGAVPEAGDLFSLFDEIVKRLGR
jgi:zinc/manganese transport system substrate-binding protein